MAAAIITIAAVLTATLTAASNVALASRDVHVGDVAKVHGPDADRVSSLVIARLPGGTIRTLAAEEIAQLIRRAVPSITTIGAEGAEITLSAPEATAARTEQACFEAADSIAADDQITKKDVRATLCSSTRAAAAVVRDLNRGIATAVAAIQPGDYLGQLLVTDAPSVRRGDKLTLVSRAGPVTIERQVTALQAAGLKQSRLFVSSADGSVFAAPLASGGSK